MEIKCGNRQSFTDDTFNKNSCSYHWKCKAIILCWKYSSQMPRTYKMLDTKGNSLKDRDFTELNIPSSQVF